jgi:hypothetical protein
LLDIYWNILTMHGPINVKSPNNTGKWQMGLSSAFKGLNITSSPHRYHIVPEICQMEQNNHLLELTNHHQ